MTAMVELENVINTINRLKTQKGILISQTSKLDKQVNDIYHMIEYIPLSASELAKVTKQLREILKTRRETKEKAIAISNFLSAKVEDIKPIDVVNKNAGDRESRYKIEASQSYFEMFGKRKVIPTA